MCALKQDKARESFKKKYCFAFFSNMFLIFVDENGALGYFYEYTFRSIGVQKYNFQY